MAILRVQFGTFTPSPAVDSGSAITGSGAAWTGPEKAGTLVSQCDSVPSSLPASFPAMGDAVDYTNKVAFFDATSVFGISRSDVIRATVPTIVGTGQALAAAVAGWTNLKFAIDFVFIDGDVYAGFPLGGGGLAREYAVRAELRLASGAVAASAKNTGSIFVDGGAPDYISLAGTPYEWSVSEAQLANAGFGVNWYVENSDNADTAELTPNFGVLAFGGIVTGDPPAAGSGKRARGRWRSRRDFR